MVKTFLDKITYLHRFIQSYAKLLKNYNHGHVIFEKGSIIVTLSNTKGSYYSFDKKEFPLDDVDKMIISYKNKFKTLWKKRESLKK